MSAAPSFRLPACPICSHRGMIERPIWKHAHNSSVKQGRNCYFFYGCRHAAETANPRVIYFEPADWAGVESDWQKRTERLFAQKTASWSDVQRTRFARELAEKAWMPGATEALELST